MTNREVITAFYRSFQQLDAENMGRMYHDDATFYDPVFGHLEANEVRAMWKMLIGRAGDNLKITFGNISEDGHQMECDWNAEYFFGPRKRKVQNRIHASMIIREGLILEHRDHFHFAKWARMALGTTGWLLGFTPFLKKRVSNQSRKVLYKYMKQNG